MRHSEDDAFRRLYAENFTAILSYTLRRVGSLDDAADLVAEIFIVAWRRRAEMPPDAEARLWLFPRPQRAGRYPQASPG